MYAEVSKLDGMVKLTCGNNKETESCNRIKISSISEFLGIYKAAPNWYNMGESDDIYAPYTGKLKEIIDKLRARRVEKYNRINVDTSATFLTNTSGESKLVYKPKTGVIFLARRKSNISSLNSLCIPNLVREDFIFDCRNRGKETYKISKKDDGSTYEKWVGIIQAEFCKQYLKSVKGVQIQMPTEGIV